MPLGFHILSSPLSQNVHMFTQSYLSPPFGVFMEASLHSHDRSNHWPLAVHSPSCFSPFPEGGGGWEWGEDKGKGRWQETQTPSRLVGSSGNQSLLGAAKSHLINIAKDTLIALRN